MSSQQASGTRLKSVQLLGKNRNPEFQELRLSPTRETCGERGDRVGDGEGQWVRQGPRRGRGQLRWPGAAVRSTVEVARKKDEALENIDGWRVDKGRLCFGR